VLLAGIVHINTTPSCCTSFSDSGQHTAEIASDTVHGHPSFNKNDTVTTISTRHSHGDCGELSSHSWSTSAKHKTYTLGNWTALLNKIAQGQSRAVHKACHESRSRRCQGMCVALPLPLPPQPCCGTADLTPKDPLPPRGIRLHRLQRTRVPRARRSAGHVCFRDGST
jgi:hypothetical protein